MVRRKRSQKRLQIVRTPLNTIQIFIEKNHTKNENIFNTKRIVSRMTIKLINSDWWSFNLHSSFTSGTSCKRTKLSWPRMHSVDSSFQAAMIGYRNKWIGSSWRKLQWFFLAKIFQVYWKLFRLQDLRVSPAHPHQMRLAIRACKTVQKPAHFLDLKSGITYYGVHIIRQTLLQSFTMVHGILILFLTRLELMPHKTKLCSRLWLTCTLESFRKQLWPVP